MYSMASSRGGYQRAAGWTRSELFLDESVAFGGIAKNEKKKEKKSREVLPSVPFLLCEPFNRLMIPSTQSGNRVCPPLSPRKSKWKLKEEEEETKKHANETRREEAQTRTHSAEYYSLQYVLQRHISKTRFLGRRKEEKERDNLVVAPASRGFFPCRKFFKRKESCYWRVLRTLYSYHITET